MIVTSLQAVDRFHAVFAEYGSTIFLDGSGEEARLPILAFGFALGGALALFLLELSFARRRFGVLLGRDEIRDFGPEPPALVGELLVHGRTVFGDGEQRVQIGEESFIAAGHLFELGRTFGEVNLVHVTPFEATDDLVFGDVFESRAPVFFEIRRSVDDAFDFVLDFAEVALIEIVQNCLETRLGTGNVARVLHANVDGAAHETAEIACRVGEAVLFAIPAVDLQEDALVVLTGDHLDGGAGELGRELVVADGGYAFVRTIVDESGYGRVMRGLFCHVVHLDRFPIFFSRALCIPRATEELPQRAIVRLARLALDIFQVFGEPKS